MPHEIYIDARQHELTEDRPTGRPLTPAEVRQRALDRRPGWLAWHLGRIGDEALIEAALAADLEPRLLDGERIGIVVDDTLVTRLSAALAP